MSLDEAVAHYRALMGLATPIEVAVQDIAEPSLAHRDHDGGWLVALPAAWERLPIHQRKERIAVVVTRLARGENRLAPLNFRAVD